MPILRIDGTKSMDSLLAEKMQFFTTNLCETVGGKLNITSPITRAILWAYMRAIREHRLTSLLSFSISSSLIASWARPEIFVHVRIHLQREYFEFHLEVNGIN